MYSWLFIAINESGFAQIRPQQGTNKIEARGFV